MNSPDLGINKMQIAGMRRTLQVLARQNDSIGGTVQGDKVRRQIDARICEIYQLLEHGKVPRRVQCTF